MREVIISNVRNEPKPEQLLFRSTKILNLLITIWFWFVKFGLICF